MENNKGSSNSDRQIKFALFADLHYKKGMYIASVSDMQAILDRAAENNVNFVVHAGDMCNDYIKSPELTNAYLNNTYGLPVYGIYGNHELESKENSMRVVTPMLTNREVVWGTADGKIGDGSIAYYYFECNGFRIVCADTNYSYNSDKNEWEHNATCSYGAPLGNTKVHSLGPVQLAWLKDVLNDAADKKMPCIVMTHASVCPAWAPCPDTEAVRAIFAEVNAKQKGTVLMAINGHYHCDRQALIDDVVYFDANTTRNGVWLATGETHYDQEIFSYTKYDSEGNATATYDRLLSELSMSKKTWFFTDPLSAIITVSADGEVKIDGIETTWYGGVLPPNYNKEKIPQMSDGYYKPFDERETQ